MQNDMTKIRLCLSGAKGRMCEAIARNVRCGDKFEIAFGVDRTEELTHPFFPIYPCFSNVPFCDVVVDFSSPALTACALEYATQMRVPILVATTGQTPQNLELINCASELIPVFFDSNTSIGNCLLLKLARVAASFLDESFDIEIVETHHRIKADAPSGTALCIAKTLQEAKYEAYGEEYTLNLGHDKRREKKQIGVHSLRGGTVVGKHEVLFLGDDERLAIAHEAESKNVFVRGALKAAEFLVTQRPGLYTMNDLQYRL